MLTEEASVALVRTQIVRAGRQACFEITAYCFMPDHAHLVVTGRDVCSDARRYIRLAKQYSGYYYKQQFGAQLWQRYGYERVIRDDAELALTIGYVLSNPVNAGLADHPAQYPFVGSERYTVEELVAISEWRPR
jgi:putative transposase